MKPAAFLLAFFLSLAAFAQQSNRFCDFGRGCVTAINYKTFVFAGAGVNCRQGFYGSFGCTLWYRIIRSNRKHMCDHHWLILANVAPLATKQSFSLVMSDLWLRKETNSLIEIIPSMIRIGPSVQRLWQYDKRRWLPGAGLGLIYDRVSIVLHLHTPANSKELQKRLNGGITLIYCVETGSMYACRR
ncbi:MAG: hypothetical protein IM638_01640 [Bacteroidetes bacterium]|nr:hypothetical protein [Bacteroidota bacterium]